MKKSLFLGAALAALMLTACGGSGSAPIAQNPGSPAPPTPPAVVKAGISMTPVIHGFGIAAATQTNSTSQNFTSSRLRTMASWILPAWFMPMPQSGSGTFALSGSYSGLCSTLPSTTEAIYIYGLGDTATPDCASQYFYGATNSGAPVIGAGTITALVIYANGTGVSSTSGKINVYDNGTIMSTNCTLGLNPGSGLIRCIDSTDNPTVADQDVISATIQLEPGDTYSNLQVLIVKQ